MSGLHEGPKSTFACPYFQENWGCCFSGDTNKTGQKKEKDIAQEETKK